jgi:hypothetical protein
LLASAGKDNTFGAFLWRSKEKQSFDWVHPYAKEDLIREFESWRQFMPPEFVGEFEELCTRYCLFFLFPFYNFELHFII